MTSWHLAGSLWIWVFMLSGLTWLARSESPPECKTLSGLDLALVADATQSIGLDDFMLLKSFLKDLVKDVKVSEDRTHVGVITYHGQASVLADFASKVSSSKQGLLELIDNIPNKLGASTFTDRALVTAGKLFSAAGGDRKDVPNVLVLFTDGKTNDNSMPYEEIIPKLEAKGVNIVVVAIGDKSKLFKAELERITDPEHILMVDDFSQLSSKLEDLEKMVCELPPPPECQTLSGLDLALVADATQSIGVDDFMLLKSFLKDAVKDARVSEDRTHVGVITYHLQATVLTNFASEVSSSKQGLLELIDNIPNKLGDRTFTDRALIAAEEGLFSAAGGDREHVPNVLVLFTDGKTNVNSMPYEDITPKLKDKGVNIVVVAIGDKSELFKAELERITDPEHILMVDDFSQLSGKLKDLQKMVCDIDGGYTAWSCWSDCSESCGRGKKSRTRTCTSPPPMGGGKDCSDFGEDEETTTCNDFVCPSPGRPGHGGHGHGHGHGHGGKGRKGGGKKGSGSDKSGSDGSGSDGNRSNHSGSDDSDNEGEPRRPPKGKGKKKKKKRPRTIADLYKVLRMDPGEAEYEEEYL